MRVPNWEDALAAVIAGTTREPLVWGRSDCFTFTCLCIAAMTGEDPRKGFGLRFKTKTGALQSMRANGFESLADAFAAKFEPVHPAMARRGDVAIILQDEGPAAGIVVGQKIVTRTMAGNAMVDRSRAVKAFRVP